MSPRAPANVWWRATCRSCSTQAMRCSSMRGRATVGAARESADTRRGRTGRVDRSREHRRLSARLHAHAALLPGGLGDRRRGRNRRIRNDRKRSAGRKHRWRRSAGGSRGPRDAERPFACVPNARWPAGRGARRPSTAIRSGPGVRRCIAFLESRRRRHIRRDRGAGVRRNVEGPVTRASRSFTMSTTIRRANRNAIPQSSPGESSPRRRKRGKT